MAATPELSLAHPKTAAVDETPRACLNIHENLRLYLRPINVNPSDCLDADLHHLLPPFTSPHELPFPPEKHPATLSTSFIKLWFGAASLRGLKHRLTRYKQMRKGL